MTVPPLTNPRVYATHQLRAYAAELEERQQRGGFKGSALLTRILVELRRRPNS